MTDIISSSFNDESINVVLNYQPPNLVNVEDDINQTRVILRQPATVVNVGERPLLEYAEVALSASYAKSASFIADDSDIYDWVRTTFYVSATDGNDDNDGKTPIYPFRTIKRAARAAKEFITGSRLIDPTIPEEAPRVTIRLSTGFYEEEAPIQIPEWTSVCGNDLRTCVVRPTPATKNQNLFQVNRGFYADGLRLEGCEIDDLTNPRSGFFFAFQEGAYITTSPYIQNCTAAFVPFDKFYAPLDPFATPQPNPEIGNGPGGMIVDDSVLDPYSPLKSMIVDAYTQVAFNGIGLVTRGAGYAQMVSFFTNFSHVGTWAIDGGHASLLNSNTTFGDYGLRAEGYRVIVVPDYDGVNSYQSEADSLLVSQSINDVRNYMMTQLQLSGSYRTDYLDTSSLIHQLTLKDSGLLIDAIATDLLALTPGKTVNWIQSQFKGQDVSADKRYTIPTSSATSASGYVRGPYAAFRINDNTYTASVPFTQPSASRDSGYLINAVATDILYGGNERSVEAARWFWVRPSVANTSQLQPTLDGIQIVKELAQNALEAVSQSAFVSKSSAGIQLSYDVLEQGGTASLSAPVPNTFDPIKVTNLSSVTSATTISQSLVNQATASFEIVYSIITDGTGSMPALVTNAENLIRVTTASAQFTTASSAVSKAALVVSGFNTVLNIIENGTGSLPTTVLNTANNIKVTAFAPTTSSASATLTEVSSSETLFNVITSIITNGTGSLPAVISNDTGSIRFTDVAQITSASAASGSEVTTISSSFAIVNYIIINGTGSMPALVENTSGSIKFNNTAQITSASGAGNAEVTKISSSAAIVTNIITNGTGSAPALVLNTSESIKFTNTAQITSASSATTTESDIISSSFAIVTKIITEGTGSIPTLVENTSGSIKFTNLTTTTSASSAGNAEVTKISSSMALIMDIISTGTGSLPTVISNTTESIKFTNTAQITSASSATSTEVTKVSSSVAIVTNIITNGTSSLPIIVYNTEENIKFTDEPQIVSGSISASSADVQAISGSIALVADIVRNGTGSLPGVVPYTTQSSDPNTIAAYYILKDNIEFIKKEVIAYISSSWSTASYNEASCSRDIGYIVSGAAEDLLYGSNSASLANGIYYYLFPSEATGNQLNFTLDGINYANRLAQKVIQNIPFVTGSAERRATWDLLRANRTLLQNEVIAYISSSWSTASYNEDTCKRDVGYIIDAVSTDVYYGGNERSIEAGRYYYLYPSQATGSQLNFTIDGINHASGLAQQLIQNITLVTGSVERRATWDLLRSNIQFIQDETIAYISSSWSTASYNEDTCKRDVNYILDAVMTDVYYGGNQRSIEAGRYYYLYPSQATGAQLNFTIDGIKYASRLAQKVAQNVTFTTASVERRIAWELLRANSPFIQEEVIAYISSSWSTASYDSVKCRRDVNYIIDSVSTDIYYGGNERSIEAGRYYYLYPSQATGNQVNFTVDGINHASWLGQKVVRNVTFTTASVERRATWDLLQTNKAFIQSEVISYISSSWSTASYDQDKCYRDVGYIIDGIATDIYYGGNQRSIESGRYYYLYPSQATNTQLDFTIDGVNYASRIAQKIAQNVTFTTASLSRQIAWQLLRANSPFIQAEVIAYISSSWSTASYDETKCKRDVNYILDSVSTDVLYGGNERSRQAGFYYYKYPSQATGNQVNFTVDGIEYASKLGQKVVQNVSFVTASVGRRAAWQLMRQNIPFIREEVIAYVSSSWPTASYDQDKCKRDVGYIVDSVSTDILYGGNERSIEAGRYYYLYPNQATTSQLNFTIDAINYAKGLAKKLILNTPYVAPNSASWAAKELLIRNKPLIQAEVIQYISSSWVTSSRSMVGFVYDQDKCFRDVGYILDGVATDILYGGNERSIESGRYYYLYPNEATNNRTQLDPTLDGIEYARNIAVKIVSGSTLVTASANSLAARELLNNNRAFIQAETIAFLSSSWRDFNYSSVTCSRDIGYIIDAVKTDLVYGGNQRSRDAGFYYYKYPNQATSAQDAATVAGVRYAKNLAQRILQNATFVTASVDRIAAANALFANKAYIQEQVVTRLLTNKTFDEADTLRDSGYIIQAAATDILYGGNERSTEAGRYFYKFPSGVLNAVKSETLEGIALVKEYAQNYLESTIAKSEIPSLRDKVDIVYDILENGTGSIANVLIPNASGATRFTDEPQFTSSATISSSLIESASNVLQVVLDIIEYGTGSIPTLVKNTSGRIKRTTSSSVQYTGSISQSLINLVTASADVTIQVLEDGTGSLPTLIPNTINNIKVTNTTQYTGSVTASSAEITKVSSSFALVTNILINGTGSLPSLVLNTSESIKYTGTAQVTSSATASSAEVTKVSSSVASVVNVIINGTGSLPALVLNTAENIKFTTASQVTSASAASAPEITKISSSIAIVTNIIASGTGSLPTIVLNTSESIKFTNTAQVTSASSAGNAEVTKISSSIFTITDIIDNGTGSLPTIITNVSESIKFTTASQATTSSYTANGADVVALSSSIALVANIVRNGTGSLPAVIPYTTASTDPSTITAYNLIKSNIPFIQAEVIAYISSSWTTASYNEASCSRDIGYIVSGAAEDLLYGSNSSSIYNGIYYYLFPSQANGSGSQVNFTVDGIQFANEMTQQVAQNITFVTASAERLIAWQLLRANKTFLQNETIAYISSSWSTASYDENTCKRDVGYIVDAIATDIYYGGNQRTVEAGRYYYLYPSQATGAQANFTIDGIKFAGNMAQKLITNTVFTTGSASRRVVWNLLNANKTFIKEEVIAYISSSWSTASYDQDKCKRDVVHVLDAVATDVYYGGNERSINAGVYYYLYPSQATGSQVNFTIDGINHASWLAQKVVQNISFSTASQARRNAWNLLRQNKQFVQDETIAWLSASWYGFDYDSAKCHRDIGYIIDGVATDIYYGGNERSRESGRYYYLYPSQATGSQLDPTVDGIEHAGILAQKVIQSISFVTASESRLAVRDILYSNIPLLQNETVAYISSSWSTASYDETKCKRDVGYIVGGIIADVLYGGNQRTRESGIYYYTYPSQATGNQLDFTVDGVNYASRIAQKLLVNTELSLPADDAFSAYKVARANKEFIAAEVIPYISSSWSTLNYNSDKCRRDVTYIVDGITTDFLYGGNERSIQSGYYYYYIPSEVTGEQVEETSTGIRYIANLVEAIMQGATFSLPTQNQLDAAELLFNNKQFIAEEIIPYVSASWSGSTYNGDKCKRDVGYILDGVITDIVYGGNERSIQSGLFYYLYPSVAVTSELDFTYAGTRYLKGMAIEVLKNTVFQEVDPVRQFVFDTLVANKAAIAQAVLNKLLDGQEKCMVCDYILAHNKIREYLIDDPEGRLTDLTPAAKVKIGQLMAMVTGTLESVVLDLQPTYLQEFGSLITSTSHVFEFGGSGANYLALPSNQYGIGQSNFDLRVFQADGGRIYTSFGDETGDFFIGLDFTIRQATGTIEGRTFNKATAARFTPLILALT